MKTIDEALRDTKPFRSLTVFPVSDGRYQASMQTSAAGGWRIAIDADPVTAIREVLRADDSAPSDEGVFG